MPDTSTTAATAPPPAPTTAQGPGDAAASPSLAAVTSLPPLGIVSPVPAATTPLPALTTAPRPVLELIGNTPLIDLSDLTGRPEVRLLAKAELANPGG